MDLHKYAIQSSKTRLIVDGINICPQLISNNSKKKRLFCSVTDLMISIKISCSNKIIKNC